MSTSEQMTPEEEFALSQLLAKKAKISNPGSTSVTLSVPYIPLKQGYIYCRVSTDMQNESLSNQESQLRALASREQIQVLGAYYEEDVSGRASMNNRPELRKLIDQLIPGQYVMVVHLDRLSRDRRSREGVTFLIEDKRCFIITPTRDPKDPNVEANDTIQYFASAMESKRIRERISNSMSIMSIEGTLRTTPWFGWKFDGKDKDWVEEPREQAINRRIEELYLVHKKSPHAIATTLNDIDKVYARAYTNKQGQSRYSKFYGNTVTNVLIHLGHIKIQGPKEAKKSHVKVRSNTGTIVLPPNVPTPIKAPPAPPHTPHPEYNYSTPPHITRLGQREGFTSASPYPV